ncbi:MAG: hypothetical protein ACREEB_14000 [Caulobacteraceae bacterium]
MNRTVAALCETREEADRMAAALKTEGLGKSVEVLDAEHEEAKQHHHGLGGWLSDFFGGHRDHRLYAEGLRRGHVLVIARVDALNETRAATIMEAAAMNLGAVAAAWGVEGHAPETTDAEKRPSHHRFQNPLETSSSDIASSSYANTFGGVRSYTI